MKFVRILLSVIVLFIVVAALAIGSLMYFIDPGKLKPVLAEEMKKQTGYEVVMDGEFSWSFYPRIGIKVGRLAFMSQGQKTPFLDMHRVLFVTDLAPLLQGQQKLRGDIYVSDLVIFNMHARDAHVGVRWQDEQLTLQPMTAALYNGTFHGIARGKQLTAVPAWGWDVAFMNVDLRALLNDVNGADSKLKLSGIGQVEVRGTASGISREQILNSVNGSAMFAVKEGAVEGIDLNYLVKSADALINKQPVVLPTDRVDQTTFESFTGTTVMRNGIVSTSDLALKTSALSATGSGSYHLIYQAINMQLRLAASQNAKTQWLIPVMLSGNVRQPEVHLDVTELNIMVAKQKLEEVKNKVREEIKQRVSGKAGQALQKLLGK